MIEYARDWRLDVKYIINQNGARIPEDANPDDGYDEIVFRHFYLGDKFKNNKGLNGKEVSALNDVCQISGYQTIQCYGPLDDGDGFTVMELLSSCQNCPYARKQNRFAEHIMGRTNHSIWFPFFAEEYITNNYMDRNVDIDSKWHVYFVTDGQYVKIGKGCDTNNRISQLQTGNPRPIKTLFRIYVNCEPDAYKLESFFHTVYREYRMCGEWFDIYNNLNVDAWLESIITFEYKYEEEKENV